VRYRESEALQILADLHGKGDQNNDLVLEFEEIKHQVYSERTKGAKTYMDLLEPGILHRVCLRCSLQMWVALRLFVLRSCHMLICFQVLYYLRFPRSRPY
jgi:hypothetical protein